MPFLPLPPEKLLAGLEEHARLRRFNGDQIPAPAHGSEALKRIVLKACAYDPKARYQSAAEMLRALEMVGEPSHATTSISSNQSVKNGDSESVDDEATVSAQLSFSRSNEEIEVPSVDGQLENNASATHELDQQSTEADETIGAFDSRTPQAPKAPTQNADSTTSQKKKGSHIWIALCVVAVAVAIIAFIKGHSTIQPTGTLNPTAVAQTTDNVVTPTEVPVAYDVIYAGWNFEALNGNECIPTLDEPVFNCTGLILQMTIAEYTGNPFGEWHLTVKQEDGTLKTAGVFQIPNDIVVGEMREYEFSFNEPLDIYGLGICSNIDSLSTIKYNEEYINVIGTVSNKSSTISSVLKSIDSVQKVGFLIARDQNSPADFLFIQRCEEICLSQGIPYIIKTNYWGPAGTYDAALELVDSGCRTIFSNNPNNEYYLIEAAKQCPEVTFWQAYGNMETEAGIDNYHCADFVYGNEDATTEISVIIFHSNNTRNKYIIRTDQTYLGEALRDLGLISGEESQYGFFVTDVDCEFADDSKQQWWCLTHNGEMVQTGVDDTELISGDEYGFILTTGW